MLNELCPYRLSSLFLLFKTFLITSKPNPRLCKNLACFAQSSRLAGLALNFLRQTSRAKSSSFSFTSSTALAIKSSATPFSRNSLATRALPNLLCLACTSCSVNLASESQPRFLKSSRMAEICSDAGLSLGSSAKGFNFWVSSKYEYSRLPR